MTLESIRKYCPLKPKYLSLPRAAMEELGLSARADNKVPRVARTMADLDGPDPILPHPNAEAVGYRALGRDAWHG